MFSPPKGKKKWQLYDGLEMLAIAMVVIILQHLNPINLLYTLNLHDVTCQLYLNKAGKKFLKK